MSQNLSHNRLVLEMRHNNPTKRRKPKIAGASVPRKLRIVWENGEQMRFPYHVLWGEKLTRGEDQYLALEFMSDRIVLRGINLAALMDYLAQEPPYIYVTPSRYTPLEKSQSFVVTDAVVENKTAPN
jgi:hypothetical protein